MCLVISAAAVAFVTIITPRGSTDKTVRAVAGIFVVSAVFAPFADMSFDFNEIITAAEYADLQSNELTDSVLDACRNAAENAILSEAEQRGITVNEICIDADINADGCIIIHSVTVKTNGGNADELKEAFGNILGVPVEVKIKQGTVF